MAFAAPFAAAGNGLWFLQRSSSGWRLLPVMQGDVSLSDTFIPQQPGPILSAYTYGAATSLNDKVASEVSSAIENADGGTLRFYALHSDLLDHLNSPVIGTLYQRLAASNSPRQKILGWSGLIRNGSAEALGSVVQSVSLIKSQPLEAGVLASSIRGAFRSTDPKSVAALGQFLSIPSMPQALREAAAHALASIHTVAALPYLAALFDDPDADLQVEAIGGFSAFANGLPVQTPANATSLAYLQGPESAPYKTSETVDHLIMGKQAISQNGRFLSFWKTWWQQHRIELGY